MLRRHERHEFFLAPPGALNRSIMDSRVRYALAIALLAGLSLAQAPPDELLMTVNAIEFVAVAEAQEQMVRGRLPFQVGNLVSRANLGAAAKVVREIDAYLTFKFLVSGLEDGGSEVVIRIAGVGTHPATVHIQEPELITRIEPEYPESLREAGVKGLVELAGTIGLDGTVRDIEILSGDPGLADAASKAVLQWRYRPALADAQPVEVRRTIPLRFGPEERPAQGKVIVKR